jgi:hypothetical protein
VDGGQDGTASACMQGSVMTRTSTGMYHMLSTVQRLA